MKYRLICPIFEQNKSMKQLILSGLAIFLTFTISAQLTQHTITVGSETREYYKYLPVNYQASENLPVVFILHGLGGNAFQMTGAGFSGIADTARIIAIYPDAVLNGLGQTAWNNGTLASSAADDISFFNLMMNEMRDNQNADQTRVYVTGFSMGAIMSHHLACALNDRVAAIGPMAGTMSTDDIQNCVPVYKTPVIHLHGTADGTVPYDGTALPSLSLVAETMDFWRNVHGCSATADSSQMPDVAADGFTIDRFVYDNCDPETSVELWRLNGVDHIYLFEPANDITEAKEIWKFFLRWQHPNPTMGITEATSSTFSIAPNPNNGDWSINATTNGTFYLYTMNGSLLETITVTKGMNQFSFDLSSGVYLLKDTKGNSERLIVQ